MTIHKLRKILENCHVPRNYYMICEKGNNDQRICLEQNNGKWLVYYTERGVMFDQVVFETESDACYEMMRRLL